MRRANTRSAVVTACVTASLVALAGCGGGDGDGTDTTSSTTSSASAEPTYDEAHIMAEITEVNESFHRLDPNAKIPADADWATAAFRKRYNEGRAEYEDMGADLKGKITSTSLHLEESDPDATGGWDVTVYNCTESTVRAYIDGEDVTKNPKGPRTAVFRDSYVTPDAGKSWQLDDTQPLKGKEAEAAPCAE